MNGSNWLGTDWFAHGREELERLIADGQTGNRIARRDAARLRGALAAIGVSDLPSLPWRTAIKRTHTKAGHSEK